MKCARIRKKLTAFLDGEVSEEEKRQISIHLEFCDRCRQELVELTQVADALSLIETAQVSPYFTARLKQRIADEKPRRHIYWSLREIIRRAVIPVTAAVLVIFSFVLGHSLGKAICQTKITSALKAQAELTNLMGISSFDRLAEGSLTKTYLNLVSGEEQ
jgi:anti-sigma factor RsiW